LAPPAAPPRGGLVHYCQRRSRDPPLARSRPGWPPPPARRSVAWPPPASTTGTAPGLHRHHPVHMSAYQDRPVGQRPCPQANRRRAGMRDSGLARATSPTTSPATGSSAPNPADQPRHCSATLHTFPRTCAGRWRRGVLAAARSSVARNEERTQHGYAARSRGHALWHRMVPALSIAAGFGSGRDEFIHPGQGAQNEPSEDPAAKDVLWPVPS
jgi:hypothetical protein